MMQEERHSIAFRCGYVGIIGEPNVGKSTLMNSLLGQRISIVTPKPQTTRHRILGILSTDEYQVVFFDTPGIIEPRYALQQAMMQRASSAIQDADLLLVLLDVSRHAAEQDERLGAVLRKIEGGKAPVILVINKIDLVPKDSLLPLMASLAKRFPFRDIIPVSALRQDGTADLLRAIVSALPVHPPLYPLDIVSEQSERFFVSEIIREKIFLVCREEIPYATSVEIVEFKEREAGKWFISADIYVERDSQKGILIGKKGTMLREIGQAARRGIEEFLQHPVFLDLHVKVREGWRDDADWLRRLGYSE